MDAMVAEMRVKITRIGAMLFERFLTDASGGNISARVGNQICITPRYSGSKYQWHICPEQVLVLDEDGNKLEGEGDLSRESKVHLRLYRDFPNGMAVIHAHPRNVLVFCSAGMPIPPVLEDTWKFGEIAVAPYAPAHSSQLAENISKALAGQEERIRKQAAATIAYWHGIFVVGKDLDAAFDAVERIDTNARCIILGQSLDRAVEFAHERQAALGNSLAAFPK